MSIANVPDGGSSAPKQNSSAESGLTNFSRYKKVWAALAVTLLVFTFEFFALTTGAFERFENASWDLRIRATAGTKLPEPRIKIITIDQKSLEYAASEIGVRWLWPRDMYEPILLYLKDAGAKAVAFDVLFTESTDQRVKQDLSFAETAQNSLPVVSAFVLSNSAPPESKEALEAFSSKARASSVGNIAEAGNRPHELAFPSYHAATLPFLELIKASAALGSVKGEADPDGVFRRVKIGGRLTGIEGQPIHVLNLPFALYSAASFDLNEALKRAEPRIDEAGNLRLQFLGPEKTIPTYPFASILSSFSRIQEGLEPSVSPDEFKDALVFVGMTAPGLLDLRPTPLSKQFPGVELNATVLDNLMNNRFVLPISHKTNLAISTTLVLLVTLITLFGTTSTAGISGFFLFTILYGGASTYLAQMGVWTALFMPIVSMALALSLALAVQYHFEGRQRAFLRSAFGHFVSPDVVNQIVDNPDRLSLGGERRELSIFFSDIAGFTALSEHLAPEQLVKLLNEYLTALTDIILKSGGTLDKYEGDAIIAFWNAPLIIEDHAKQCVNAALDCQRKLEELRDHFEKRYGIFPNTRMGINSGTVTVGNFGSHSRFDYTMIGDATNLAARLEGVNKVFGTNIIISHYTYEQVKDSISCRRIGTVKVVGKNEPITLYEPLTSASEKEQWAQFAEALEAFESGELEEAEKLFRLYPNDPVSKEYVKRASSERAAAIFSFDPIWNLTSK